MCLLWICNWNITISRKAYKLFANNGATATAAQVFSNLFILIIPEKNKQKMRPGKMWLLYNKYQNAVFMFYCVWGGTTVYNSIYAALYAAIYCITFSILDLNRD